MKNYDQLELKGSAETNGRHPASPVFDASGNMAVYSGLTKREHFAGLIAASLCANPGGPYQVSGARMAVNMADALLLELAK